MIDDPFASLLEQIHNKPVFLESVFEQYDRMAREVLDFSTCFQVQDVLITGCGDSYACALSAEMAFQRLAQVPTRACNAMAAGRYHLPFLSPRRARHTLVIALSVSGSVARTVEVMALAQDSQAQTLAVTAHVNSALGQRARRCFELSFPSPLPANLPGIQSFLACQLALMLLAIRLGEATNRLTAEQAAGARRELRSVAGMMTRFVESGRLPAASFVHNHAQAVCLEFLGSGPNFGTALFSAAKAIESAGSPASAQDIEEFHHLEFFERPRSSLPVVLFAPFGHSYSRAVEIALEIRKLERPLAVVVQRGESELSALVETVFVAEDGCHEEFTPLLFCTAGELLAAFLMRERGEAPYRGFAGVWQGDARPYSGIRTSRAVSRLKDLKQEPAHD